MWSCTLQIGWRKVKTCRFSSPTWFCWLSIPAEFAVARERRTNDVHLPAYKSVGNKYDLTSVSDWPIIMIGSGGLLVVLLHVYDVLCWLCMWSSAVHTLDEEKSKYAGLAHQNSLGSAELNSMRWLVKHAVTMCTDQPTRKFKKMIWLLFLIGPS